jgi:hypothetical protein
VLFCHPPDISILSDQRQNVDPLTIQEIICNPPHTFCLHRYARVIRHHGYLVVCLLDIQLFSSVEVLAQIAAGSMPKQGSTLFLECSATHSHRYRHFGFANARSPLLTVTEEPEARPNGGFRSGRIVSDTAARGRRNAIDFGSNLYRLNF